MPEPYRPRVAPADATATLPFADERTFGGDIARGLGDLGSVFGQAAVQRQRIETERDRSMQASEAAVAQAQFEEEVGSFALERQDAGHAGYHEDVSKFVDERAATLLASVRDERLRARVSERLAGIRATASLKSEAWQRGEEVRQSVDNYATVMDIRANRAGRAKDGAGFASEVAAWRSDLELDDTIPDGLKPRIEKEGIAKITASFIEGRPPEERMALLESGQFDALPKAVYDQLKSGAEVDLRRIKLEEAAAARAEQAKVASDVDSVMFTLDNGGTLADADLQALQERASAAGLADDVRRIGKARVIAIANREYGEATPVQIEQEVRRLDKAIADKGDAAPLEWAIRRDALEKLREARGAEIDSDPEGFAAKVGIAWQPLDGAPASAGARIAAAKATAQATGRPVTVLMGEEVEQYRANMGTAEGQRAAIDLARMFFAQDPAAGRAAMRQLAPDDRMLDHLVGLAPYFAGAAIAGRAAVKAKGYVPPSGLDEAIRAQVGGALTGYSPEVRGGIMETARALYAYHADRTGLSSEEVGQALVKLVVDHALGSQKRGTGGITQWNGRPFVLPASMTPREFGQRLNGVGKLTGAFWGDGKTPVTPRQLREEFTPVRVGGTRYAFQHVRSGQFVTTKGGEQATLDIMALPVPQARGGSQERKVPDAPVWIGAPRARGNSPYAQSPYGPRGN